MKSTTQKKKKCLPGPRLNKKTRRYNKIKTIRKGGLKKTKKYKKNIYKGGAKCPCCGSKISSFKVADAERLAKRIGIKAIEAEAKANQEKIIAEKAKAKADAESAARLNTLQKQQKISLQELYNIIYNYPLKQEKEQIEKEVKLWDDEIAENAGGYNEHGDYVDDKKASEMWIQKMNELKKYILENLKDFDKVYEITTSDDNVAFDDTISELRSKTSAEIEFSRICLNGNGTFEPLEYLYLLQKYRKMYPNNAILPIWKSVKEFISPFGRNFIGRKVENKDEILNYNELLFWYSYVKHYKERVRTKNDGLVNSRFYPNTTCLDEYWVNFGSTQQQYQEVLDEIQGEIDKYVS